MTKAFRASPDVIIRTSKFDEATRFYTQVLGLEVAHSTATLVGLDAGAFRLYLEPGPDHGPVFDFRVPDFRAAKEALLAAGEAQRARDTAFAVQQWFAGAGNPEAEWRAWLVVSSAQKALGDTAKSQQSAQKAAQILAALEQKWDSDSYKSYLDRPDIQDRDKQLAKLAAAR